MKIEELLTPVAPPLRVHEGVTVRVTGTRVPLESLVYAYQSGETAEQIANAFDTVPLADVYAVLAFYMRNKQAVEEYLADSERLGDEIQRQWQQRYPAREIKRDVVAKTGSA